MAATIFFSWQADTPPLGGRNFVERALERALTSIGRDTTLEEAVRDLAVDMDTKDVGGFPPIVETIFRKIDNAAIFVPDLTFVGKRLDGRPTPNANVLIEYGWALKSLTHARIIPVMNTAFGEPTSETMPFDMLHLRRPISYICPADASDEVRKCERNALAKSLEGAIRTVLDSQEFKDSLPKPPSPLHFGQRSEEGGIGRFKKVTEPIGLWADAFGQGSHEVMLSRDPAIWFRMMPVLDPGRTWRLADLENAATRGHFLEPLSTNWRGYDYVRSHEGFGIYAWMGDDRFLASAIVFLFTTGEVWSIDAYHLRATGEGEKSVIPNVERYFRGAMQRYGEFLARLGLKPPFKWMAGLEHLKGRGVYVPAPPGQIAVFPGPQGKCLLDVVSDGGLYSPGDPIAQTLKPLFTKVFESCGVSRPDWLDK